MNSSLIVEPLLNPIKMGTTPDDLNIEREIVLASVFSRVEEETGTRPAYNEETDIIKETIPENICLYLDYLKRFACYLTIQGRPPAISGEYDPDDARRVIEMYRDKFNTYVDLPFKHLVLTNYPDTYYLPPDFHIPVIITQDMFRTIAREQFPCLTFDVTVNRESITVGSLIRLSYELDEIDELLLAITGEINENDPFYAEKIILKKLYNFVQIALKKNQIITWIEKSLVK